MGKGFLLPCQQKLLRSRAVFPSGHRLYQCDREKVAAVITGPTPELDVELLLELCARCRAKEYRPQDS